MQIGYSHYRKQPEHIVIIKSEYTLEKIERTIKNEKRGALVTQDTRPVSIYTSVNKCILS
jgi:UDP-N-acetylglucosamine pyrophosphorylase